MVCVLQSLKQHAEDRGLETQCGFVGGLLRGEEDEPHSGYIGKVCYWIAAFAVRQWDLPLEVVDVEHSSFRAMGLCKGGVVLLDGKGAAWNRLW